jgi:biotin carboxyl carrier protein
MHARTVTALVRDPDSARITIAAPAVGWFRPAIAVGDVLRPGDVLGTLEVLGAAIRVLAPVGTRGAIVERIGDGRGEFAVAHGQPLCVLDPEAAGAAATAATVSAASSAGGLVFPSPLSGRFYARPAPGKPAFVAVGDVLETGQTLGMLEIMKTFHRVTFRGDGLPPRARIVALLVTDEDDVTIGQPLVRLEDVGEVAP